jgi:hypothetical protein
VLEIAWPSASGTPTVTGSWVRATPLTPGGIASCVVSVTGSWAVADEDKQTEMAARQREMTTRRKEISSRLTNAIVSLIEEQYFTVSSLPGW